MGGAQDKCGVFAVVSLPDSKSELIASMAYLGIFALQHRGQESAGISVAQDDFIVTHKGMGTVNVVFQEQFDHEERSRYLDGHRNSCHHNSGSECERALEEFERTHMHNPLSKLHGTAAIAHVRYSTRGESGKTNVHPIEFSFQGFDAAIAHNGNLVNLDSMEEIVASRGGYNFPEKITTDTALIAALIATSSKQNFWEAFLETLPILRGSFSLVALHRGRVYAAKDEFGLRPLCRGTSDDFFYIASETRALRLVKAHADAVEIGPGHALAVDDRGLMVECVQWAPNARYQGCSFEVAYFSSPGSVYRDTVSLHIARRDLGKALAREHPFPDADIVVGVPDSGRAAAIGYAEESNLPLVEAIIRDHQTGRSFIEPVESIRREFRDIKYIFIPEYIHGQRIVVVDDSIVRGNTAPWIVECLKEDGAEAVYFLSSFPRIEHGCHLGIDLPTREELIAYAKNDGEIREALGADYVGYLSFENFKVAFLTSGLDSGTFCYGCVTGDYPVARDATAREVL